VVLMRPQDRARGLQRFLHAAGRRTEGGRRSGGAGSARTSWHSVGRPAQGISSGSRAVERRVEENSAGGGARGVVPAVSGGGQKQSRGEARMPEEEESRQESEGPICKLKNFQGLLCKERFPIDTKS
jgi:hypothetical protein